MGFGLLGANRMAVRSAPNPMDKCTIYSVYPWAIDEIKPTIQPGHFRIEAGSIDNPKILVVGTSCWWKDAGEDQPLLEIAQSSIQVAESVINDYCNGLLACDMGDAKPGLFWVPGEKSVLDIQVQYPKEIDKAAARQKNWFAALVKMADALWARSNGNPLAISDQMRLAAQQLQMNDRGWIQDFSTLKMENCPACGVLRNNQFPVCQHCHTVVDAARYKELGLKAAS